MKELLRLELNTLPPTVNHMYMSSYGRRFRTEECRDFQEQTVAKLRTLWNEPPFTGRAAVVYIFATNNKRRWDIDNRVKALQDCLAMAGVIKDDAQIDFIQIERQYSGKISTTLILKSIED